MSNRHLSTHQHRDYYIRSTEKGIGEATDRYDIIDINEVSLHIEWFQKHIPYSVHASYLINTQAHNADASLIAALYESKCHINLNSIVDVRTAARILGVDTIRKHSYCFSSQAKTTQHISEAMSLGIDHMTVSYPADVFRISSVSSIITLVLQITPLNRNKLIAIMDTAKLKGMAFVGIALGSVAGTGTTRARGISEEDTSSQSLALVQYAYDLASTYGHRITYIDLGTILSECCQKLSTQPFLHQKCSTITETEEVSDQEEEEDSVRSEEASDTSLAGDSDSDADGFHILGNLLNMYLPNDKLGLTIYAQHAQYFVPDQNELQKWWGMPKVKRPVPSLYSYLATRGGGSSKSSLHERKAQRISTSSRILNNSALAAAQA